MNNTGRYPRWYQVFFNRRKANRFAKNTFINNAFESAANHDKDTITLLEEVRRLQKADKIHSCFHRSHSKTYKIRTILGQYANSYLDTLKYLKSNPDMTLKELHKILND